MDARIRPATIADLFWLRLLLGQLVEEAGATAYPQTSPIDLEATTAALAARLGAEDSTLLAYVAENEAVIGGFMLGDLLSRVGEPRHFASITYAYVVPGWRAFGVGRAISRAVADAAKNAGAEAIEFLSRPGDEQWIGRGWPVVARVHALPIDAARASVVSSKASNGHHIEVES